MFNTSQVCLAAPPRDGDSQGLILGAPRHRDSQGLFLGDSFLGDPFLGDSFLGDIRFCLGDSQGLVLESSTGRRLSLGDSQGLFARTSEQEGCSLVHHISHMQGGFGAAHPVFPPPGRYGRT